MVGIGVVIFVGVCVLGDFDVVVEFKVVDIKVMDVFVEDFVEMLMNGWVLEVELVLIFFSDMLVIVLEEGVIREF